MSFNRLIRLDVNDVIGVYENKNLIEQQVVAKVDMTYITTAKGDKFHRDVMGGLIRKRGGGQKVTAKISYRLDRKADPSNLLTRRAVLNEVLDCNFNALSTAQLSAMAKIIRDAE